MNTRKKKKTFQKAIKDNTTSNKHHNIEVQEADDNAKKIKHDKNITRLITNGHSKLHV